jgi:hypothetical protein
MTTKSGTNSLHGSFFETARNNGLGIARARQNAYNYAAPKLVRNEFGASAGGPIILPRIYHGKDKSFWFFAYERESLRQDATAIYSVPTMAMRGGDFSGLINSSGVLQQLYDPNTTTSSANCNGSGVANQYCRAPFPNNQIPIGRLDPLAKTMYDITPQPTLNDNPLIQGNYNFPGQTIQTIPTTTLRLDHNFNETNKVYLRFQSNNPYYVYPGGHYNTIAADGIPAAAGNADTFVPQPNYAGALGYTHVFSPTFYSETVLGQQWFSQFVTDTGNPHFNYEAFLNVPNNLGGFGFPQICTNCIGGYNGNQNDYGISQIVSTVDENLTKTVGRHQMQFGGRYRHERLGYQHDISSDVVGYDNLTTSLYQTTSGTNWSPTPNTGYTDGDFFLGSADEYGLNKPSIYSHFRSQEMDGYFQDNYHVSQHLTLNLGVRYEIHPGVETANGVMPTFDLKNDALVFPNSISYYINAGYTNQAVINNLQAIGTKFETPSQAGYPSNNFDSYDDTFSPRIGLAYQPFGGKLGTVVRGGWGRYIYPAPVRNTIAGPSGNVPFTYYFLQLYNGAQSPDGLANYQVRQVFGSNNPSTVYAGVNDGSAVNTTQGNVIAPGQTVTVYNPDYPPIYVQETNFTIEQPLKGNSALRVTWLWTHGQNLDHSWQPNNPASQFVWEMATGTVPPNGGASTIGTNQYASTATRPYDNTTWGTINYGERNGFSNDNELEVNYERQFHHGIAYQVYYVWSKPFRFGANSTRDSIDYPIQNYLGNQGIAPGASYATNPGESPITAPAIPPPPPRGTFAFADYKALNIFQNYKLDSAIPLQHIFFNGIVDLPVGRGKRFMGDANRFVNELVGGFQLAGDGQIISQDFQPASSHWGAINPIQVYKGNQSITDCSSGVCHPEKMWFNGYISPKLLTPGEGGTCTTNCVTGLPSNYVPYEAPIDNNPNLGNFGTDNVALTAPGINGGVPVEVPFAPGPGSYGGNNPYSRTFIHGPMNYNIDLSLYKVFPITERTNLRFNVDDFNALNIQGYNNPNTTSGEEAVQPGGQGASSYWSPRQLQLTLRLTF